ncbi:SCP2 sterol-binding domain-containing protein [Endozoicomonadaceae bacterium StTr2]
MATVRETITGMKERFNAEAAAGEEHVFQFAIGDNESWHVAINDGQCDIVEGEHDDASVTLKMDETTFIELITGEIDGMQAFMQGRVQIEGDMMLSLRLTEFFTLS